MSCVDLLLTWILICFAVSTCSCATSKYVEPTPPDGSSSSAVNVMSTSLATRSLSSSILQVEKEAADLVQTFLAKNINRSSYAALANITMTLHRLPASLQRNGTTIIFSDAQRADESVRVKGTRLSEVAQGRTAVISSARITPRFKSLRVVETSKLTKTVVSNVLSLSVFAANGSGSQKLSVSVEYRVNVNSSGVLLHLVESGRRVVANSLKYSCVYFDTNLSDWSTYGCRSLARATSTKQHSCACNHTSAFAVVLAVRSIAIPATLTVVANVLEGVSIVALVMTLLLLVAFHRRMPGERFFMQFSMALSLLLLHVSFLLGSLAASARIAGLCAFAAVCCHLFTITSAMWMLNEGVVLFLKTRTSLSFDPSAQGRKLFLAGWVIPALYVSLCSLAGFLRNTYLDTSAAYENTSGSEIHSVFPYDHCWLSSRSLMILTAVVPLTLIFTTNGFIAVYIVRKVRRLSREAKKLNPLPCSLKSKRDRERSDAFVTCKATLLLLPVLGVPWLLGLLVNIPGAEIFFLVAHALLNGLQGLIIALVFCVVHQDLRQAAKRKLALVRKDLSKSNDFSR